MQRAKTIKKKHSREGLGDRVFNAVAITIVLILTVIVILPLMNVVAASFSSSDAVNAGKVLLLPIEFTLDNYRTVLKYNSVWIGYRNTIFYTAAGTVISVLLSLFCAYPLATKRFSGRKFFNKLFLLTMIFNGGMIPTYIVVRDLKLLNSVWSVLLPTAISFYNVIIMRNYIETTIPDELEESARVDGCSPARYFVSFVVPLAKPIIAVIAMYYAVAQWNDYFNAFLYLTNKNLYPLQLFLREILISSKFSASDLDPDAIKAIQGLADTLKYVIIVVSTLPLMCIYPFVQKYFVKGVMIGSVKG
ncbi:MAG: carbohydrate ABC transporter permease [Lachnospiraceae bacterium]|nr:carbohydrate ABC transporter permease [Lachnospiraceae bacterium]